MGPILSQLDLEPFHEWLNALIADRGSRGGAAALLGITTTQLDRLTGANKVSVQMADRVFIAGGDPGALARLYPLDVSAEERWCPSCAEHVCTRTRWHRCVWCDAATEEPRSAVAA